MRKFTKEISALLASAAVGAAVYAGAISASSEQPEVIDNLIETTSEEYFAGGLMADPPEDITEPTTIPPLAGDPMPPDELIESTTAEEELPPLEGDAAPADGDINGDGSFGIADVVTLQKWLLSETDTHIANWRAADLNYDNRLDAFDLCLMKMQLIESQSDETAVTTFGLSPSDTGVDDFLAGLSQHNCIYEDDKCFNITPAEITEKYGFRIFKYDSCCESYLEYKGNIYQLGTGFGGYGTLSFAVADLDRDGNFEVYFTFSYGSGIHHAQIGCFDTAKSEVSVFDYSYPGAVWGKDIVLYAKDGKLGVYEASLKIHNFVDIETKPKTKIGEIASEDGTIVFNPTAEQLLYEITSKRADDIDHVTLTAYPPGESVQLTKEQISELLVLLKDVTLYEEDDSYNEYGGRWVQFDIAPINGKEISIAEFNPFFIINRKGYKAEYESCQALSVFANSILNVSASQN